MENLKNSEKFIKKLKHGDHNIEIKSDVLSELEYHLLYEKYDHEKFMKDMDDIHKMRFENVDICNDEDIERE